MIVKCKSKEKSDCPMIHFCLARLTDPTITGCGIPLYQAGVIQKSDVRVEHTVSNEPTENKFSKRKVNIK